ncbi:protease modulator HflC [Pokkaliibacter sp. MBI-7]|uniref:Protein HflC n=1 Tax=Proteobacteria bacterium 228 TaxID=2083153 RepID=A0A2S5KIF1_9PROT|nr:MULTISPECIES: protease modulator HflC [Pokkaliibacter]MDH2432219.1 protease modulator HflC [Pokkaliibacter sp. MBI-7]PPC74415.1 protease modulator HflC [Pokkaliibacter plantistimulans]
MSNKSFATIILVLVIVIAAMKSLYVINETERAVVLRFGEVVNADVKPGLHAKIPFIDNVRVFDSRVLTMDSTPQRYLTLEKKALIVDSFVKWNIQDVEKYYTATSGDEFQAAKILAARVDTGLRNQFGSRTLNQVVSGKRDEVMSELTEKLTQATEAELGIRVRDIRIKKIDLPPEVSQSVYERMRTEREREARELRSRGKELAEGIKADADRQRTIIKANAYRDSERIRGEGDAQAASIYSRAYQQDPQFYSFYRSLTAYKNSLGKEGDLMVIQPDSDFFRFLNDPSGAKSSSGEK